MGRGVAGRGQGAAGGSGGAGFVARRPWVAWADRGAFSPGGVGVVSGGVEGWPADDRDRDVRPVDGAQAALPVGVQDAGGGGVGLDPSASVLPDRVVGAGAGRVDGQEADTADRPGDGERADARPDREGDAGEAVPDAGGEDRLDGDRGRREVPDRRGPRSPWGPGARARGPQARRDGRRAQAAGAGSLPGARAQAARVDAHDPSPQGRGEGRGAQAHRANRRAARALGARGQEGWRSSRGPRRVAGARRAS